MGVIIHNPAASPFTLPAPLRGVLSPGQRIVVEAMSKAEVLALLGIAGNSNTMLRLTEYAGTGPFDSTYVAPPDDSMPDGMGKSVDGEWLLVDLGLTVDGPLVVGGNTELAATRATTLTTTGAARFESARSCRAVRSAAPRARSRAHAARARSRQGAQRRSGRSRARAPLRARRSRGR